MKNHLASIALAAAIGLTALPSAQASSLFQSTTPTGDTALPGSYTYNVNATSGLHANASFQLQGYISLDGQNYYEDDVTLSQNGSVIYQATFDLGGGGANQVYIAPVGSTFSVSPTSTGNPTFNGGLADVTVPVLLAASNSFTISYTSLITDHAGYQGIGDEGFGVNNFSIAAVPLPAGLPLFGAALLMLAGCGWQTSRRQGLVRTSAAISR